MSFGDHISDLKELIKYGDSNGKNKGMYMALAIIWILMFPLTIFAACLWFVPVFAGIDSVMKIVISITAAVTLIFGIIAWFSMTKEK